VNRSEVRWVVILHQVWQATHRPHHADILLRREESLMVVAVEEPLLAELLTGDEVACHARHVENLTDIQPMLRA